MRSKLRWQWNALLLTLVGAGSAWAQLPAPDQSPTAPAPATAATPGNSTTSATPAPPPAAAPATQSNWQPDNRLTISGNGETLTGVNGGGGGSISYLAQVNPTTFLGVAGEYQTLAGSHWEFGSLDFAYSHALTQSTRWDLSGEAHEGSGQAGATHFGYGIEAVGGGFELPGGVTLSAEDRQIDVDTSHGSLPKGGLSKLWGTHVLTSIGYAQSTGGNLDTQYGLARVDVISAPIRFVVGGDAGHVSPSVLDIQGILLPEARRLSEEFVGVTRPTQHVDFSLLADRIDLAGLVRLTYTLTVTIHIR